MKWTAGTACCHVCCLVYLTATKIQEIFASKTFLDFQQSTRESYSRRRNNWCENQKSQILLIWNKLETFSFLCSQTLWPLAILLCLYLSSNPVRGSRFCPQHPERYRDALRILSSKYPGLIPRESKVPRPEADHSHLEQRLRTHGAVQLFR
jgi:hypothetical protein